MVSGNTCNWPRWWLTWGGAGGVTSEGRGEIPALILGKSQLALGRSQSPHQGQGGEGHRVLAPLTLWEPLFCTPGVCWGGHAAAPSREIQKCVLPRDQGACSVSDRLRLPLAILLPSEVPRAAHIGT